MYSIFHVGRKSSFEGRFATMCTARSRSFAGPDVTRRKMLTSKLAGGTVQIICYLLLVPTTPSSARQRP
jgi:hypothetical protein